MADAAGQVAVGAGAAADGAGGNHADAVVSCADHADVSCADHADDANYAEEVINII